MKDQASCAREVLDGRKTSRVQNPTEFLQDWKKIIETPRMTTWAEPPIESADEVDPFWVISAQDIRSAMPSAGSSAGPDGFTGKDLRSCPMVVLQVLLNLLILQGRIPTSLQGARTTFIPKTDEASSVGDFRPITVASILVRLFHKILSRRILSQVDLDMRQRAFIPVDGCGENIAILSATLHEAKTRFKPLYMASLDISKAFDSVSTKAIIRAACRKGLSSAFIRYLEHFYATSTTVLNFEGTTLLTRPARGARQGDPLSPLLFNLVIDEWLASLDPRMGFSSGDFSWNAMAFADDLVVAASTPDGLRELLSGLEVFLAAEGYCSIRPSVFPWPCSQTRRRRRPRF